MVLQRVHKYGMLKAVLRSWDEVKQTPSCLQQVEMLVWDIESGNISESYMSLFKAADTNPAEAA